MLSFRYTIPALLLLPQNEVAHLALVQTQLAAAQLRQRVVFCCRPGWETKWCVGATMDFDGIVRASASAELRGEPAAGYFLQRILRAIWDRARVRARRRFGGMFGEAPKKSLEKFHLFPIPGQGKSGQIRTLACRMFFPVARWHRWFGLVAKNAMAGCRGRGGVFRWRLRSFFTLQ